MSTQPRRRRRAAIGALFLATILLTAAAPASAGDVGILAVTCSTHKGNTAGWAHCSGTGSARLVIDCKAPQITDYWSDWHVFNNTSGTIRGECNFGINSVGVQTR